MVWVFLMPRRLQHSARTVLSLVRVEFVMHTKATELIHQHLADGSGLLVRNGVGF